jgi:hypothetical protein
MNKVWDAWVPTGCAPARACIEALLQGPEKRWKFKSRRRGNAKSLPKDLNEELERLRNENAALKKGASSSVRMKVSEKGAVSIYGMGRFPVTLYKEQWLKLLDMSDEIRAFISANEMQLKAKD